MATIKALVERISNSYAMKSTTELLVPDNPSISILDRISADRELMYKSTFMNIDHLVAGMSASEAVWAATGLTAFDEAIKPIALLGGDFTIPGSITGYGDFASLGSTTVDLVQGVSTSYNLQATIAASYLPFPNDLAMNAVAIPSASAVGMLGERIDLFRRLSEPENLVLASLPLTSDSLFGRYVDPASDYFYALRSHDIEVINRNGDLEEVILSQAEHIIERVVTVVHNYHGNVVYVNTAGNNNIVVTGDGNEVKAFSFRSLKRELLDASLSSEQLDELSIIIAAKKLIE